MNIRNIEERTDALPTFNNDLGGLGELGEEG